jgi:hypothetical protein
MAATTLDDKSLNLVTQKLYHTLLPKLGFNRHFPRVLITAPKCYGGIDLMNLSDQQGYAHLETITRHLHQQSPLSKFFLQLSESFQIQSGMSGSCWETLNKIQYVTSPWLPSIWKFLSSINTILVIPQLGTLRPLRENDTSLMDIISKSTFSSKEIIIFNNTRLFLKLTSIAEICTASGKAVHPSYTTIEPTKQRPKTHGDSKLIWPRQPPSNRRMWRVWLKGLKLLRKPSSWNLQTPVGSWNHSCSTQRLWYAYQVNSTNIRIQNIRWEQHHSTHTKQYFQRTNDHLELGDQHQIPVIPALITNSTVVLDRKRDRVALLNNLSLPWDDLHQLTEQITFPLPQHQLMIKVQGNIISNQALFQWEIFDQSVIYFRQQSLTPKMYTPDERQAAVIGLVSSLTTLQSLQWHQPIKIHVNTTQSLLKKKYHRIISAAHNDLNHILKQFTHTIEINNNIDFPDLDPYQLLLQEPPPQIIYPTLTISIQHASGEVLNLRDFVKQERHFTPIQQYMITKYNWDLSTFHSIDWAIHEAVLKRPQHQQLFNIKFIQYWLPVATHGAVTPTTPVCLRCNASNECQDHWYRCPHGNALIHQHRTRTEKFLATSGLHPLLQGMINQAISFSNVPPCPELTELYQQQACIGWSQLLQGRISTLWVKTQNRLTNSDNGDSILIKVCSYVFIMLLDLWRHINETIHGSWTGSNNSGMPIPSLHCTKGQVAILPTTITFST